MVHGVAKNQTRLKQLSRCTRTVITKSSRWGRSPVAMMQEPFLWDSSTPSGASLICCFYFLCLMFGPLPGCVMSLGESLYVSFLGKPPLSYHRPDDSSWSLVCQHFDKIPYPLPFFPAFSKLYWSSSRHRKQLACVSLVDLNSGSVSRAAILS